MNLVDLAVILVIIGLLVIIFYVTRPKKSNGCSGCHADCSSCGSFSQLYADYKKDHANDNEKSE